MEKNASAMEEGRDQMASNSEMEREEEEDDDGEFEVEADDK